MWRFAALLRARAGRSGCVYVLAFCLWCAAPAAAARAQDATAATATDAIVARAHGVDDRATSIARAPDARSPHSPVIAPRPPQRPASLVPLYISFGALQAMDVHSTTRALGRGATEANPLLKGIAGNPVALSAVKIGGSAAAIYAAEKMWKKNRKGAVIFMIAANTAMAVIVGHNYRSAR